MNIGIFKPITFGLIAATLSACSEGNPLNLAKGLETGKASAAANTPLSKAVMMRGAVTLVPPAGYCIDSGSLQQNFALLARCDLMGAKKRAQNVAGGVMTVSLAAASKGGPTTLNSVAQAAGNITITDRFDTADIELARALSDGKGDQLTKDQWRAVTQINDTDLSIALFAPAESVAVSDQGRSTVTALIKASKTASATSSDAADMQPNATNPQKGFRATVAGLFD